MRKSNQAKFYWLKALGILAIVSSASAVSSPAIANSLNNSELYLAQVGVRSRINAPTPLNLRPRTHISLPSRRSSTYNRTRDYRYSEYNDDYYRGRRTNRTYRRRHSSDYNGDISGHRHRNDYNNRSRNSRSRGSFTIYF